MFDILKKTKLNDDVNSYIFGMIKDLSVYNKVMWYPDIIDLFENEFYCDSLSRADKIQWSMAFQMAAKNGNKKLIRLLIDKGCKNWKLGMYGAVRGGHMDLVKFFIEIEKLQVINIKKA